jgi:hypothetical protein
MEVGDADFVILHEACTALDAGGIPYVIGGGTVVVLYGRQRRTKDFDVFLNRKHQRRAMDALSRAGFTTTDTEKSWLFKAWRDDTLVDLIVESRGGIQVTAETIDHSRIVNQYGYFYRVMGPEDTLFRKILTLTEGRPDWHDALSIMDRQQDKLDWDYFLHLARRHARRILSFMLFAQTELHNPPGTVRLSPDILYTGEHAGPVPDRIVYRLLDMVFEETGREEAPAALEYLPKAA